MSAAILRVPDDLDEVRQHRVGTVVLEVLDVVQHRMDQVIQRRPVFLVRVIGMIVPADGTNQVIPIEGAPAVRLRIPTGATTLTCSGHNNLSW